jgi:hypothetical protein
VGKTYYKQSRKGKNEPAAENVQGIFVQIVFYESLQVIVRDDQVTFQQCEGGNQ